MCVYIYVFVVYFILKGSGFWGVRGFDAHTRTTQVRGLGSQALGTEV